MERGRFYWSPGKGKVPSYYSYRDIFADSDIIIISQWLERPSNKEGKKYGFWAPKFVVFDKNNRKKMYVLEGGGIYMGGFNIRYRKEREKEENRAVNENIIQGNPFQGGDVNYMDCEIGGEPMNSEEISMHQRMVVKSMEYWDSHIGPVWNENFPTYDDIMEKYIELFIGEMRKRKDISSKEKADLIRYFEDNLHGYERLYRKAFREKKDLIWRIK